MLFSCVKIQGAFALYERTHTHAVGIRAVTSIDGMTSNWSRIPYEV